MIIGTQDACAAQHKNHMEHYYSQKVLKMTKYPATCSIIKGWKI